MNVVSPSENEHDDRPHFLTILHAFFWQLIPYVLLGVIAVSFGNLIAWVCGWSGQFAAASFGIQILYAIGLTLLGAVTAVAIAWAMALLFITYNWLFPARPKEPGSEISPPSRQETPP